MLAILRDWLEGAQRSAHFFAAHKNALAGIQSASTIIALYVGGWWAYRAFVRGRDAYPRCDIAVRATHRTLGGGSLLLHVEVDLQNHGKVLAEFDPEAVYSRIHQVLPVLGDPLAAQALAIKNRLSVRRVEWPLLAEAPFPWSHCELEPGEKASFEMDFPLSATIQTVRLYVYCVNRRKRWRWLTFWRSSALGWQAAGFYDLTTTGTGTGAAASAVQGTIASSPSVVPALVATSAISRKPLEEGGKG
jgi:hypothetical protein